MKTWRFITFYQAASNKDLNVIGEV